ncbi:GAF domain-containing protein [Phreatobacter stygius]|uniref:GAF domain-containing protein n=2 Tax=Phreatobacter stygius TaxID=1940610 RepID=A0A4D7BMQ6_9HYPH|nr:GAF domain-containing protein [Phreatobacter stygius]
MAAAPDDAARASGWVLRAATHLLAMPIDRAISAILAEFGELAGADRAWMFEYDESLLRFRNTHEWSRAGVSPHVEDLQDAPVTMIAWLHRFLVQGQAVMINDVAGLPRTARSLQAELLRQDDKSVLSVPLVHQGVLRGCIGFDATARIRRWEGGTISALFHCAQLIGLARYSGRNTYISRVQAASGPFTPLIYLRMPGRARGIVPEEILGLRAARDYTDVWLVDGSKLTDHRALSVWAGMLPTATFLRIHRTAIVNLGHVEVLDRHAGRLRERWELRLRSLDTLWVVSRPYRAQLRSRLGI